VDAVALRIDLTDYFTILILKSLLLQASQRMHHSVDNKTTDEMTGERFWQPWNSIDCVMQLTWELIPSSVQLDTVVKKMIFRIRGTIGCAMI
jgi:hypothetical protein